MVGEGEGKGIFCVKAEKKKKKIFFALLIKLI
jgi:hypothetical protein